MLDVIVFGTGNYLQKYKKYLENKEINIVAYLDNNINKCGMKIDNVYIYLPEYLKKLKYDYIILMSIDVYNMKKQLLELNVEKNKIWYIGQLIEYVDNSYKILLNNTKNCHEKVLIYTPPIIYDGGTRAVLNLTNVLTEIGYEVHIVSYNCNEKLIKEIKNPYIKIIEKNSIPYGTYNFIETDKYKYVLVNSIILIKNAVEMAETNRVILWVHDPSVVYMNTKSQYNEYLRENQLDRMEIYAVSNIANKSLKEYLGINNARILTCAAQDSAIKPFKRFNKTKVIFAIIGNICKLKNQKIFTDAIKMLPDFNDIDLEFYIIGRISEKKYYDEIMNNIQGFDNIKYMGEYESSQMKELYNTIDVVVCASVEETLSLTIVEGMMNKKVCITSSNTGVAKYIEDYCNGMVFEVGNYKDLADKMAWIIKNIDKCEEIGKNARNTYDKNFSIESFKKRILEIF